MNDWYLVNVSMNLALLGASAVAAVAARKAYVNLFPHKTEAEKMSQTLEELVTISHLLEEKNATEGDVECPICLGTGIGVQLVPCGHVFCGACAGQWTVTCFKNPRCPLCRKPFVSITPYQQTNSSPKYLMKNEV